MGPARENDDACGGTGAMPTMEGPEDSLPISTRSPHSSRGHFPKKQILPFQRQCAAFYNHIWVQLFVAALIVGNFLTFILTKQIDPLMEKYTPVWIAIELAFNGVFTLELVVNMYGSWFCQFWQSGWNIFDFVVVTIGILDTAQVDLGPLRMLRMMRAFRVFRLFKKIESLNKIIVALGQAIPGMMNALLINMIFMCIYAVLAVDFFGYVGDDCVANPIVGVTKTGRDRCFGFEYYGNFGKSLYTLFQVLTGDSWSEAVVRPIMNFYASPVDQFGSVIFFISFILINGIVLINVVIAVLVEKASAKQEEPEPVRDDDAAEPPVRDPTSSMVAQVGGDSSSSLCKGLANGTSSSDCLTDGNSDPVVVALRQEIADFRQKHAVELKASMAELKELRRLVTTITETVDRRRKQSS
eukprot:TRINITY_DN8186_c0_g1_i1.p1 TRINITY_DN8186_c0_g1~~TRINITY_DN8186_c0_g1_i1.p1  ORF type:complete len:468 (+),score=79.43 TRINITY_DN8186_c0_g1_i1:170-1405(+)